MIIIPLEKMTVPPRRQRQSIGPRDLNSLADSIQRLGLLHPIVVRPIEAEDGTIYQLVCGQRRLEAVKSLDGKPFKFHGADVQPGHIPATFLSELDDLSRMEAELEENIRRVELSDIEVSLARAGLHKLRQLTNPEQTQKATAEELAEKRGTSVSAEASAISRDLIIERHKDEDVVRTARNANEAYANISRRLQAQFETRLAKATGKVSPHTLIIGDALTEMEKLERNQFDVIIADPPYGIGADEFGDAGATHTYSDDPEMALKLCTRILSRGMYLAKPSAHLYMFCDIDTFITLRDRAEEAGWAFQRAPIIWHKGMGFDPHPGIGFRRSYEMILYCWKGGKPHRGLIDDVISIRGEMKTGHAAEKPVELYKRLLSRSCIPGDHVLDPCCGSGTVFPSATSLQLVATGIEIDPAFEDTIRAKMI